MATRLKFMQGFHDFSYVPVVQTQNVLQWPPLQDRQSVHNARRAVHLSPEGQRPFPHILDIDAKEQINNRCFDHVCLHFQGRSLSSSGSAFGYSPPPIAERGFLLQTFALGVNFRNAVSGNWPGEKISFLNTDLEYSYTIGCPRAMILVTLNR